MVDEQHVEEAGAELRRELMQVEEHAAALDDIAAELMASVASQIKAR